MNKFQKLREDIKTFVNRRRGKQKDTDENDEASDGEEFNGDKEDEKPGNVPLNGGEHGMIFGINRKIVTGIIVTGFLIVSMATYTALHDSKAKNTQQNQPVMQKEEAASSKQNDADKNGYDALFRENQKAALAKNGKTAQNPNGTTNGANPAVPRTTPQTSVPTTTSAPVAATRTVPAIAATPSVPASYSTPYTLPSAAYQPSATPAVPAASSSSNSNNAEATSSKAASEEEKSLEERVKSAISFAIGGGSGEAPSTGGASTAATTSNAATYTAPSEDILQAGTIIPAILYSGIDTANAGQVTAQVASDVYDSATGTNLLIPAGSSLIGSYSDADGASGRVNVTFSTLILPDGGSYAIGNSIIAVDGQGYSGIVGDVHHHRGATFANGIWNSAMTALSTLAVDNVTLDMSAFTNLTQGTKPTITVDPGAEFNLFVTVPIAF